MRFIRLNNTGLTLVELIVAIGILGIVTASVFSFFFFNYKTFNRAQDQIDVQYEAQIALDSIVYEIIECGSVTEVYYTKEDTGNRVSELGNVLDDYNIYKIVFNNGTTIRNEDESIYLNSKEIGVYIKSFSAKPLPLGEKYSDCKGLEINLAIDKENGIDLEVTNSIFFRN